uniref:Uncharacterized protein n=1 Tax=Cacopsylla melanoneura TaxID=428564 RepID=A0A8D8TCT5_9HEMI
MAPPAPNISEIKTNDNFYQKNRDVDENTVLLHDPKQTNGHIEGEAKECQPYNRDSVRSSFKSYYSIRSIDTNEYVSCRSSLNSSFESLQEDKNIHVKSKTSDERSNVGNKIDENEGERKVDNNLDNKEYYGTKDEEDKTVKYLPKHNETEYKIDVLDGNNKIMKNNQNIDSTGKNNVKYDRDNDNINETFIENEKRMSSFNIQNRNGHESQLNMEDNCDKNVHYKQTVITMKDTTLANQLMSKDTNETKVNVDKVDTSQETANNVDNTNHSVVEIDEIINKRNTDDKLTKKNTEHKHVNNNNNQDFLNKTHEDKLDSDSLSVFNRYKIINQNADIKEVDKLIHANHLDINDNDQTSQTNGVRSNGADIVIDIDANAKSEAGEKTGHFEDVSLDEEVESKCH